MCSEGEPTVLNVVVGLPVMCMPVFVLPHELERGAGNRGTAMLVGNIKRLVADKIRSTIDRELTNAALEAIERARGNHG